MGCQERLLEEVLPTTPNKALDLLFVVDNSPGMLVIQGSVATNIPRLIQALDARGVDYHIGVTTSDVGTQTAPGAPWGGGRLGPACESYAGDDGALQRIPCTKRIGGRDLCNTLCANPEFLPQDGAVYIAKVDGKTNVPKELVKDPMDPNKMIDIGPQKALQCMLPVWEQGCGIEGQLEGAWRALDGHNPINAGFLREGSVLGIVFLTEEDDCSVALSRRSENTPMIMSCPIGAGAQDFRCFNPDYRCMARSITCNEPLDTPGRKTGCVEQESYLEPTASYARAIKGLRPPNQLLVAGLWTLPAIDKGGNLVVRQANPDSDVSGLYLAYGQDAGCISKHDAAYWGFAQLRLSKFAAQIPASLEFDICDKEHYPKALDQIATALLGRLAGVCLGGVPRTQDGQPRCTVTDVASGRSLSTCSAACCAAWTHDPAPTSESYSVRAACKDEQADCFCAQPSAQPQVCPGSAMLGVWRQGGIDKAGQVRVRCTVAG